MAVEPPNPIPGAQRRYRFVALIGLATILLVAALIGMVTYKGNDADTVSQERSLQAGQADIYLETLEAKELEPGSVVKIGVYENSGAEPINAVQAAVKYPTDKVTFTSLAAGSAFPVKAVTDSATPGLVRFAQNVEDNSKANKGKQLIATLEFTVKQPTTPMVISIDRGFSLVVRSTDNKNILVY